MSETQPYTPPPVDRTTSDSEDAATRLRAAAATLQVTLTREQAETLAALIIRVERALLG
jgi:hypothetical protein